jgi:hypothetical protein
MDPISILAGILSVLQTSGAVLNLCAKIRAGLRRVPLSLIQITEEVRALRDIAEAIESALDRRRSSSSSSSSSSLSAPGDDGDGDGDDEITRRFCRAVREPLVAVVAELAALESRLLRVPVEAIAASRWEAMRHSVSWSLGEQETKECIERLERCKSSLGLAIASQNS